MCRWESEYSTHVLELVRNNGKPTIDRNQNGHFLLFDYFDILIHEELTGKRKVYKNYFSIADTFHDDKDYKVSYKTLSLYCKNSEKLKNPFGSMGDGEELSQIPFLGLIQISLCKENYQLQNSSQSVIVDEFLTSCENKILNAIQKTKCFSENDPTVMQLYRSSTTGDFCLAMRTDSADKVYNVALALNGSQNSPTECPVLTYTNVGIECKVLSNGSYGTLSQTFIDNHIDLAFALRFSADGGLLPILEQYEKVHNNGNLEAVKGLFGRYDYLLHIGIKDFAEIYPLLCEKKFGKLEHSSAGKERSELKDILNYPHIKNINERLLVDLKIQKSEISNNPRTDVAERDRAVTERNEMLYTRIMKLKDWKTCFSKENRSFHDLHRGMVGIYKTFSALGMEREAYLNWKIFCQDMETLCESLEYCFENCKTINKDPTKDESWKRSYRLWLLKDWRINIQAINQYTRLVQNINYQTYQSPIYEIQTQIDTEKTMIAYRQSMMSYMESYTKDKLRHNENVASIIPIIYPDLSKDKVEVTASFISQKRGNTYIKTAIMCTVPSFEYFGRLYDLLPWLLHEASHHLRILDREERNRDFAEYVFSHIFNITIENSLPELSDDILYRTVGRVEQRLVDIMTKVTLDDLLNGQENPKNFSFEKFFSRIDGYLRKLFSSEDSGKDIWEYDIDKIRNKVFQFYLGEYRKAGNLTDELLDQLLNIKQEKFIAKEKHLADTLSEGLLKRYSEQLAAREQQSLQENECIVLNDLWKTKEWFEKELAQVHNTLIHKGLSKDGIKDYIFKVTELYKIANAFKAINTGKVLDNKYAKEFLEKVFTEYLKEQKERNWDTIDEVFRSPGTLHVLRKLGLLNGRKDTFCSQMMAVLHKLNYKDINRHKEMKTVIYREAFADLLMVTSLNINSFGYIRQVLQTISDARVDEEAYWFNDINRDRFRIVTAILLSEELNFSLNDSSPCDTDSIRLDGTSIVEKGIIYCEYTLKCIYEKLMEIEDIQQDDVKKESVNFFLGSIKRQLNIFLSQSGDDEIYDSTFLYILLHGKVNANKDSLKLWEQWKYDKISEICEPIKYIFLRLECFCVGLNNILQDRQLIVPINIYKHMKKIRDKIKKHNGIGCCWEQEWDCLIDPKKDVGKFFNEPELVFDKKSYQKLEKTIEFIQNYYYYNRFKMAGEEIDNEHNK